MLKTINHLAILLAFVFSVNPAALPAQCGFESDINVEPMAPNGVYCSYDTVKMSIAEPFDNYQWYYNFDGSANGLMPIGGAGGPTLEIPVGDYGYAFFFAELTRDDCTQLSEPAVIDSWVFAPPAIQHEPQSEYCRGDSALITNAFGSYASYQWLRDYEPIDGATGPEYWVKESGTYVLNVFPFECPETVLTSGIGPTFSFSGPQPPTISWDGSVLTATSGPEYQWFLNGTPIDGATGQSYTPLESGIYTVRASDGSNCRPISGPISIVISGAGQPAWARQFSVFPNPVGDALYIRAPRDAAFEVRALNAEGKEVMPRQLLHAGAPAIPTGGWTKGVYLLQVHYQGEATGYRVVKQ